MHTNIWRIYRFHSLCLSLMVRIVTILHDIYLHCCRSMIDTCYLHFLFRNYFNNDKYSNHPTTLAALCLRINHNRCTSNTLDVYMLCAMRTVCYKYCMETELHTLVRRDMPVTFLWCADFLLVRAGGIPVNFFLIFHLFCSECCGCGCRC